MELFLGSERIEQGGTLLFTDRQILLGAGNANQSSLSFTIDTQIQTPTVDMLDSADSGVSSTDNWTNNAKPTFSAGNLDADVVAVEVLIDGTSYNAVNANGRRSRSCGVVRASGARRTLTS